MGPNSHHPTQLLLNISQNKHNDKMLLIKKFHEEYYALSLERVEFGLNALYWRGT